MIKSNLTAAVCMAVVCIFYAGACVQDKGPYTQSLPKHKVEILGGGIYARVLVPAGSSVNQLVRGGPGEQQPIDFLPYPGNWGEVIHPAGNTLHVMILTDALAKGSILEIKPIAVLQLDSSGVARDVIVAVPTDSLLMSVRIGGFTDLITDYEPVRYILQTWFVNHRGFGAFQVLGWRDESYALKLLSKTN